MLHSKATAALMRLKEIDKKYSIKRNEDKRIESNVSTESTPDTSIDSTKNLRLDSKKAELSTKLKLSVKIPNTPVNFNLSQKEESFTNSKGDSDTSLNFDISISSSKNIRHDSPEVSKVSLKPAFNVLDVHAKSNENKNKSFNLIKLDSKGNSNVSSNFEGTSLNSLKNIPRNLHEDSKVSPKSKLSIKIPNTHADFDILQKEDKTFNVIKSNSKGDSDVSSKFGGNLLNSSKNILSNSLDASKAPSSFKINVKIPNPLLDFDTSKKEKEVSNSIKSNSIENSEISTILDDISTNSSRNIRQNSDQASKVPPNSKLNVKIPSALTDFDISQKEKEVSNSVKSNSIENSEVSTILDDISTNLPKNIPPNSHQTSKTSPKSKFSINVPNSPVDFIISKKENEISNPIKSNIKNTETLSILDDISRNSPRNIHPNSHDFSKISTKSALEVSRKSNESLNAIETKLKENSDVSTGSEIEEEMSIESRDDITISETQNTMRFVKNNLRSESKVSPIVSFETKTNPKWSNAQADIRLSLKHSSSLKDVELKSKGSSNVSMKSEIEEEMLVTLDKSSLENHGASKNLKSDYQSSSETSLLISSNREIDTGIIDVLNSKEEGGEFVSIPKLSRTGSINSQKFPKDYEESVLNSKSLKTRIINTPNSPINHEESTSIPKSLKTRIINARNSSKDYEELTSVPKSSKTRKVNAPNSPKVHEESTSIPKSSKTRIINAQNSPRNHEESTLISKSSKTRMINTPNTPNTPQDHEESTSISKSSKTKMINIQNSSKHNEESSSIPKLSKAKVIKVSNSPKTHEEFTSVSKSSKTKEIDTQSSSTDRTESTFFQKPSKNSHETELHPNRVESNNELSLFTRKGKHRKSEIPTDKISLEDEKESNEETINEIVKTFNDHSIAVTEFSLSPENSKEIRSNASSTVESNRKSTIENIAMDGEKNEYENDTFESDISSSTMLIKSGDESARIKALHFENEEKDHRIEKNRSGIKHVEITPRKAHESPKITTSNEREKRFVELVAPKLISTTSECEVYLDKELSNYVKITESNEELIELEPVCLLKSPNKSSCFSKKRKKRLRKSQKPTNDDFAHTISNVSFVKHEKKSPESQNTEDTSSCENSKIVTKSSVKNTRIFFSMGKESYENEDLKEREKSRENIFVEEEWQVNEKNKWYEENGVVSGESTSEEDATRVLRKLNRDAIDAMANRRGITRTGKSGEKYGDFSPVHRIQCRRKSSVVKRSTDFDVSAKISTDENVVPVQENVLKSKHSSYEQRRNMKKTKKESKVKGKEDRDKGRSKGNRLRKRMAYLTLQQEREEIRNYLHELERTRSKYSSYEAFHVTSNVRGFKPLEFPKIAAYERIESTDLGFKSTDPIAGLQERVCAIRQWLKDRYILYQKYTNAAQILNAKYVPTSLEDAKKTIRHLQRTTIKTR